MTTLPIPGLTLNGMNVCIREPRPKMTLSEQVPVTDEFRASINAWMLEFFGTDEDLVFIMEPINTIFMSSRNWAEIRKHSYSYSYHNPSLLYVGSGEY
mgnify:CR=1 FL=1